MNILENLFTLAELKGKKRMNLDGGADFYDRNKKLCLSCRGKLLSLKENYYVFDSSERKKKIFQIISRKILAYDNCYCIYERDTGHIIGEIKGTMLPSVRVKPKSWEIFNNNIAIAKTIDSTFDTAKKFIQGFYKLSYKILDMNDVKLAEINANYNILLQGFINFDIILNNKIPNNIDKRLILSTIFLIMICTR